MNIARLESEVTDDILIPYKEALPRIIEYTLQTGEVVNIYKFMGIRGFHDFLLRLDDYITIIGVELFINALDEHGVIIHDTPGYRDMMIEFLLDAGIPFDEKMYDTVDLALPKIEDILVARYSGTTEAFKLCEFLSAASPYTNITYIISKIYSIIAKNYSSIISDAKSIDNIVSNLSDAVDVIDISDSGLEYNENVLELITTQIKEEGLYKYTFLEYMDDSDKDIYKILTGGKKDV